MTILNAEVASKGRSVACDTSPVPLAVSDMFWKPLSMSSCEKDDGQEMHNQNTEPNSLRSVSR